jgi:hypothetical protein
MQRAFVVECFAHLAEAMVKWRVDLSVSPPTRREHAARTCPKSWTCALQSDNVRAVRCT